MPSHVEDYKGYHIDVRVEKGPTYFATWQIREIGRDRVKATGAVARDKFTSAEEARAAAIDKAKAWIDQQAG